MSVARPAGGGLADWIAAVHAALAPLAIDRAGADLGPVRLRHRSARPDWFGVYDDAWARPLPPGAEPGADAGVLPPVDLVTAAIADVPAAIGPPPAAGSDGDALLVRHSDHDGVVAWHPATGRAVHVRHRPPDDYDAVTPLRPLVHWAVTDAGGVLVHAAVVGRAGRPAGRTGGPRGLLIVGEAGHGKSTTTLAALDAGWATCGDDTVALFPRPDGWWAEAVYGAVKTKVDAAHPVPEGVTLRSWTIGDRKWVHRLTGTAADRLAPRLALDAIVVLAPDRPPDAPVRAITPGAARTALAPSTVAGMPDRQPLVLQRVGCVARDVPAVELPRRADLADTARDLDAILDAAGPVVSVVIPVHEGTAFVADAITSVVAQTTGHCEIVVVDDASTDDSLAVVEGCRIGVEAAGHTLVVVHQEVNRGVAAARNRGIAAASADLLAFLDQDDRWTPDHLAVLHHALRAGDADAAFGKVTFTDLDPGTARPWVRDEWFTGDHPGHVPGAALVRRAAIERIGTLDETVGTFDDVDWYLRLGASDCTVVAVDTVVLERRVHTANQSRHLARESDALLTVVRRHLARTRTPVELDVVIPVRDGLALLPDAVASALAQEGADVRVIVVDDGSTDGVVRAVDAWDDPRVTVLRHATGRGIGAARNTGAAHATRAWLAFLDADDRWPTDRTRRLAAALADDPDGIAVGRVAAGPDLDECATRDPGALPPALLAGGLLLRRATFARVGPYDETLAVGEFVEWMDRARRLGIAEHPVAALSLLRRVHDANTTRNPAVHSDYLRVVALARARVRS